MSKGSVLGVVIVPETLVDDVEWPRVFQETEEMDADLTEAELHECETITELEDAMVQLGAVDEEDRQTLVEKEEPEVIEVVDDLGLDGGDTDDKEPDDEEDDPGIEADGPDDEDDAIEDNRD
jgi:hypothetical protein